MKRKIALLGGIVVVALAGSSGVARASGAQVIRDRFHGPFAEAAWEAVTPSSVTDVGILTSREQNGTTHLSVGLNTTYLDANGNATGSLAVSGNLVAPAFSFDTVGLTAVSASGSLPVTNCTFDAAGNQTGCSDGTLAVSGTWTGQGQISRGSQYEDQFVQPDGFTYIDRGSGTFRSAGASATIGSQTFDATDLQFADLGVSNDMTFTLCPHGC